MTAVGYTSGDERKLGLTGGTLTGPLILAADPVAALGAATKQYVDGIPDPLAVSVAAPTGDAVADRAAIATAIAAAVADGLPIVQLRAGTYLVGMAPNPNGAFSTYRAGVFVPSGITLRGYGRDQTTIKLAPLQTYDIAAGGMATVIMNATPTGGDENITFQDFTVDGSANGQGDVHHNGITLTRTRGVKHERVRVKNVRGEGFMPPDETFHFETQLGIETTYNNCEAIGESGQQTASGFSANVANSVHYVACTARGMKDGQGFTHYRCSNLTHVGCRSYLNGYHGFNSENTMDATYVGCHAGGVISNNLAGDAVTYPYTAGTTLGNGHSGFVANGSTRHMISACSSRYNVNAGITVAVGGGETTGRIVASTFSNNGRGFACATASQVKRWRISGDSIIADNTVTNFDLPTGYILGPGSVIGGPPAVPASGVAMDNPYPFTVSVYVKGGAVSLVQIGSSDIATATGTIMRLQPGQTFKLFYTTVPVLVWFAD